MSEELVNADVVKPEVVKAAEEQKETELQIDLDMQTAMTIRLQEFDKKIAEAELAVATLKKDKFAYIYDQNVQQIVTAHRERTIKSQIEEETKRKMQSK